MKIADLLEGWAENPDHSINIKLEADDVQLNKQLRHLPKRRLTCLANWQGKRVVAKFFYGSLHKLQAEKEALLLKALIKAKISTPSVLLLASLEGATVLLIEYIEDSRSLLDWMDEQPSEAEFEAIFSSVTELVLACHQAGFEIKDPHLGNFLISNGKVFIIDAGDINLLNAPLSTQASINNLALLYAQLPVTFDEMAFGVLTKQLGKKQNINEKGWQTLLIKQRRWRQKRFIDKKVFRECTAYICKKNSNQFLVAKRSFFTEDVARALETPDALIKQGYLLKDGQTATVARVEIAGKKYVLKRYNIKKKVRSILKALMWSRAAISWRNGLLLEMLGIPTAKSYAFIEERLGIFRRRSYLLSEYVDAPQAWYVFENSKFNEQDRKEWAKNIYELFLLLKRSQISHGDLKAQNILCPTEGAVFIDLDGLKSDLQYKEFLQKYKKDIQRFGMSWPSKWHENPYFSEFEKILIREFG
ncbi:lipopolysaccharide kinase InaA family protein [uncultured Cycloclasticus sp.]|uniref:lipopolysaccharide kinase InaA family protein n=1 Tax=uncultured Cycloclasticus sp. TaxID=172194 RepID=UPI00258DE9B9|nr:lipopolysaccharide kinase InaA family protein [uncultured Cycloclasticus sp.]